MIGWLNGTVRDKRPPHLLVEVNGVGYELEAPMTTFYGLPDAGQNVALFTHQAVRDDRIQLYGFSRAEERDAFRALLRVNGVGARVALAVLLGMDAGGLARCVGAADAASLSRVPGIGKKTAERLVMELRGRFEGLGVSAGTLQENTAAAGLPGDPSPTSTPGGRERDPAEDAVAALVALGFKPPEAVRRVRDIATPGLVCEELVRRALQAVTR